MTVPPGAIPLFMSEIEAMGGAERSILALGRWLHARGRPVYLLTYFDRVGLSDYADFPFPTLELQPAPNARAKVAALRHHLAGRPETAPAPMTSGYQPALHCALAGTGRFHCLMHDTPSLFAGPAQGLGQRLRLTFSNWQIGRAMRRNRGVMVVTSEYLQNECRVEFHVTAHIARMGGLAGQHAFRRRSVRGELRMLSVSRIEENKRIDWMLDSLAALEHATPRLSARVDWRLDLAGKGSQLGAMINRTRDLQLENRVRFLGFVSDRDLEQLYETAHLFLMPAIQGYGIPAIEALQRGLAVLLHRESGVSDLLFTTPWATVIKGGKEEMTTALSSAIDWLLQNNQEHAPAPPELPTEEAWAERVATLCGYV